MLYEAYLAGEFNSVIQNLINENKQKYSKYEDYYEGRQWSIEGITTRNGLSLTDRRKLNKVYTGITDNKIKDAVDTMATLVYGVNGVSFISNEDININWEEVIDEVTKEGLKFDKAYIKIGLDIDNKITLKVPETKNIIKFKGGYIEVINYDKKIYDLYEQKDGIIYKYTFEQDMLVSEYVIDSFPIYEIELDFDYLESLINIQDVINAMKTQEFEINKYQGDPLTALKGVKLVDDKGRQLDPYKMGFGAGDIITLGSDGEVNKVDAKGITPEFESSIKNYEKGFYKLAKLNSLRNDDLSGTISGYAIELRMIDTINFVNKIRGKILNGLVPVFEILKEVTGEDYTIVFSNIIRVSIADKIEEAKGLRELGYTDEEIRQFMGKI